MALEIDTPAGLARAHVDVDAGQSGVVVLGHGAGGGVDARDLVAAAEGAQASGWGVVRVEQPYRVAGRRSPPPAGRLDASWTAVIEHLRRSVLGDAPLVVGGRSSGARVACRTAGETGAAGVVCLAFPLQVPGRSSASRLPELDAVTVPTLVVQGVRDPYGMPPAAELRTVVAVDGDHALRGDLGSVAAAVSAWLGKLALAAAALVLLAAPASSAAVAPHLPTRHDHRLQVELAHAGASFHGWAAIFVEDLATGRYAGWNELAPFPAASTVKVAVLVEGIRRFGFGAGSPIDRDLRAIGQWSSNDAANRVFALVGGVGATTQSLHRLGMFASTYPGPYVDEKEERSPAAVPAPSPPPRSHIRVTTARDLARALFRLQAAAAQQRWAMRVTGLSARAARAALGYLSLAAPYSSLLTFPPGTRHAEKDGWLDDVRASAAIAYLRRGARIVVVLAYRPGITQTEARALGRRVSAVAFR